jgi:hypothetical protein
MRLGALYSVFNGIELLEKSINQIIDHVDVVVICYQTVSNVGECDIDLYNNLKHLSSRKVHLCHWIPDLSLTTKQNERNKHNAMLKIARSFGCTHFLMSACDHFYDRNEFFNYKTYCEQQDFDVTLTAMYTYYKHPTWQLFPIEEYYMPFICKLYEHTEFVSGKRLNYLVDPSLVLNTSEKLCLLPLMMHHYSMVRVDILSKFRNAAAGVRWTAEQRSKFITEYENYDIDKNEGIEYFKGRKVKVVPNYFEI